MAQSLDAVPQHRLHSGTPCAHDVIVNHCNSCPSHSPWSLAPGLVIHDISLAPCSAWTPSALLSFAARRDAQSGSRVERRPGKGHAITERRDGVVGSKGGGHSTPRSQTMATSKPSRAPPPECAARLPRGGRDGDVGSRSLGRPRVPHPSLSGVPCPDGPSPPSNRKRRPWTQCAETAPRKGCTTHPEGGRTSNLLAMDRRCHADAPPEEKRARSTTSYCAGGGAARRR